MKDNIPSRKQKTLRSLSNSPPVIISDDDDSPKEKYRRKEKHARKKHHKHHRHRGSDSSDEDIKPNLEAMDKEKRHRREAEREFSPVARVKEEPVSEDERERKHRHRDQPRVNGDSSRRNDNAHSREDDRKRSGNVDQRGGTDRNKRHIKEEPEPEWGKKEIKQEKKEPPKNNAKPDFGLSGKLTEDANTYNGIVIKYSEPPEARKPKRRWRLYPFKGETSLPVLHIHRQSAYLMGRDRNVADIPIDHPSCSKQHAALQYRLVPYTRADGSKGRQIKLYVIDLESANGTYLNNNRIEAKKYYELKEKDVVKFGYSSREYVLLHEHSKDSDLDDDVQE